MTSVMDPQQPQQTRPRHLKRLSLSSLSSPLSPPSSTSESPNMSSKGSPMLGTLTEEDEDSTSSSTMTDNPPPLPPKQPSSPAPSFRMSGSPSLSNGAFGYGRRASVEGSLGSLSGTGGPLSPSSSAHDNANGVVPTTASPSSSLFPTPPSRTNSISYSSSSSSATTATGTNNGRNPRRFSSLSLSPSSSPLTTTPGSSFLDQLQQSHQQQRQQQQSSTQDHRRPQGSANGWQFPTAGGGPLTNGTNGNAPSSSSLGRMKAGGVGHARRQSSISYRKSPVVSSPALASQESFGGSRGLGSDGGAVAAHPMTAPAFSTSFSGSGSGYRGGDGDMTNDDRSSRRKSIGNDGLGIAAGGSLGKEVITEEAEDEDGLRPSFGGSGQGSTVGMGSSMMSPNPSFGTGAVSPGGRTGPTLVEQHADLLTFIAKKERKCLDLREELKKHEDELKVLKRKWESIVAKDVIASRAVPLATPPASTEDVTAEAGGLQSTATAAAKKIFARHSISFSPSSNGISSTPNSNNKYGLKLSDLSGGNANAAPSTPSKSPSVDLKPSSIQSPLDNFPGLDYISSAVASSAQSATLANLTSPENVTAAKKWLMGGVKGFFGGAEEEQDQEGPEVPSKEGGETNLSRNGDGDLVESSGSASVPDSPASSARGPTGSSKATHGSVGRRRARGDRDRTSVSSLSSAESFNSGGTAGTGSSSSLGFGGGRSSSISSIAFDEEEEEEDEDEDGGEGTGFVGGEGKSDGSDETAKGGFTQLKKKQTRGGEEEDAWNLEDAGRGGGEDVEGAWDGVDGMGLGVVAVGDGEKTPLATPLAEKPRDIVPAQNEVRAETRERDLGDAGKKHGRRRSTFEVFGQAASGGWNTLGKKWGEIASSETFQNSKKATLSFVDNFERTLSEAIAIDPRALHPDDPNASSSLLGAPTTRRSSSGDVYENPLASQSNSSLSTLTSATSDTSSNPSSSSSRSPRADKAVALPSGVGAFGWGTLMNGISGNSTSGNSTNATRSSGSGGTPLNAKNLAANGKSANISDLDWAGFLDGPSISSTVTSSSTPTTRPTSLRSSSAGRSSFTLGHRKSETVGRDLLGDDYSPPRSLSPNGVYKNQPSTSPSSTASSFPALSPTTLSDKLARTTAKHAKRMSLPASTTGMMAGGGGMASSKRLLTPQVVEEAKEDEDWGW